MYSWKEINKRMKNKWKNKKSNKIVDMSSATEINKKINKKPIHKIKKIVQAE